MFGFKDRDKDARGKSEADSTQILVAPGTEITYKASLIDKYHDEHRNLQRLFNDALSALQLADHTAMLKKLRELKIALRRHLLDEELSLYIYLRHCYGQDKPRQELITKFKKRSKKVGMETFGFINKVEEEEFEITRDDPFISEFLGIGNMLETLIESEEAHLYPIYKRPF